MVRIFHKTKSLHFRKVFLLLTKWHYLTAITPLVDWIFPHIKMVLLSKVKRGFEGQNVLLR
jgi:hypothetical protein